MLSKVFDALGMLSCIVGIGSGIEDNMPAMFTGVAAMWLFFIVSTVMEKHKKGKIK